MYDGLLPMMHSDVDSTQVDHDIHPEKGLDYVMQEQVSTGHLCMQVIEAIHEQMQLLLLHYQ